MVVTLVLALAAGLLTSLSPCVLPMLPIVVGAAAARHRMAPVALALGMLASFVVLGVGLASGPSILGLSAPALRNVAAAMLVAAGLALWNARLQALVTSWLQPLASWAARRSTGASGLRSHFALGGLLGALWSPCTGPTLGAAIGLASQGSTPRASLIMLTFGVGATLPLLAAAYATRAFGERLHWLRSVGGHGKSVLGALLVGVGSAILLGLDRRLEAWILQRLPDGWIDLLTRF